MRPVYYLAVFIPIAVGLELAGASAPLVFFASALGVIPTAALMSDATEHLASPRRAGHRRPAERHVRQRARADHRLLRCSTEGLQEVVKASLVGSIIGNSLLVLGASMLVGGWKREKQTFNGTAAQAQAGDAAARGARRLIMPAVFQLIHGGEPAARRARSGTTSAATSSTSRSASRSS